MLDEALRAIGMATHAAEAVVAVVARTAGLIVLCGPAGVGKTTVGDLLGRHGGMTMLGDLCLPGDVAALTQRFAVT